ncbi:MAG: EamA family transporter [Rhodospirillales bacterium]
MTETRTNTAPQSDADAGLWTDALPAVFVVLWATGFIGSRLGAPYSEPFTFLGIRFAAAAVLMTAICLATRVTWPKGRTAWFHAGVIGLLVHGVYLGGVFWAIDRGVSPGVAALIVGMQPILTGIAAGPLLGETVSRKYWVGLGLGFCGVALVVWDTVDPVAGDVWGIGACVIGMIAITAGSLYQKKTGQTGELRGQQSIQLTVAAVFVLSLSFAFETQTIEWSLEFIVALAWLTLVMSLGTFTLLYVLIRRGAASKVSSLFYLVPPTAALMAYALFDETLSPAAIAGMALAVSGVALASRRS